MAKTRNALDMTDRWVQRVEIPQARDDGKDSRTDYFDTFVHGLGLRVSSTGYRSWLVLFRVKGSPKLRSLTLGKYPTMTLADARSAARLAIDRAAAGEDPAQAKQVAKGAPTLSDVAKDYMTRYAKAQKRSWWRDEQILNADVLPHLGDRKAHEVKRRDILDVLDRITARGAPIQANRTLAIVRKLFNWAISRDLVETNPCAQVKAPAPENQRDRMLSEGEIRAVWQAVEQQAPVVATMFKIRLLTAQRGGEVETMRWADVDLDAGWWTIPAARAKNKLSHRVPLAPPAIALVKALQGGDSEWVFPSPTRKGRPIVNIQKAADRIKELAGVDFVPHDLRRTAASHMTSMGIDARIVSKILNHVERGVIRVYDRHSYDAEKRQALDAWADRLLGIVG